MLNCCVKLVGCMTDFMLVPRNFYYVVVFNSRKSQMSLISAGKRTFLVNDIYKINVTYNTKDN